MRDQAVCLSALEIPTPTENRVTGHSTTGKMLVRGRCFRIGDVMALDIIGAGFGRTGTESMKRALEMLGYGPCYHMYEVMPHKSRYEAWQDIYDGIVEPDWDAIFDGFKATVDWPAARYWPQLAEHYPGAKILLTYRDPESWYASMEKTILALMRDPEKKGMAARLARDVFAGSVFDKDHIISTYERNVTAVQDAFEPNRLLTYQLGSGWEPLCTFLHVSIPSEPYPRGNDSAEFHARDKELGKIRDRPANPASGDQER